MSASAEVAVIPHHSALDLSDDPASVMVALVDQAKTLLAQATGMEGLADVIEWKNRAEAIRVYTMQKDMGHEAELSAAEIVRRAERRIGQLIREGQAAGEIKRKERHGDHDENSMSPAEFLPKGQLQNDVYGMTDEVSDDAFDEAIEEAKEEGNLSRANIVRKVRRSTTTSTTEETAPRNLPLAERAEQIRKLAKKNLTSPQIADRIGVSPDRVREIARRLDVEIPADAVFGGKFRKVDPNKVIESIVADAQIPDTVLAFVAYSELDRERLGEWVSSLTDAIGSLTTIKRNLQKELTRDTE